MTLRPPLPSLAVEHHLDTNFASCSPSSLLPVAKCLLKAKAHLTCLRPFIEYTFITTSSEPSSCNNNSYHEGQM